MSRKKVFVSYDHETDGHCRSLLETWNANPDFDFLFNDRMPREIDKNNVVRIKVETTVKINSASHTLVIVGKDANTIHRHQHLIGFRNWMDFEIHQSKLHGNKIVAVRLQNDYEFPDELMGAGASWALGFDENEIIKALNEA